MPGCAFQNPVFKNAGDSGLIVEFGTGFDVRVNNAVIAFESAFAEQRLNGVVDTTPTIKSVLIRYNPLTLAPAELRRRVSGLMESRDWLKVDQPEGRSLWRIPALYGGEAGPDLAETADLIGMSEDAAIESHCRTRQRVFMIGFAPGQAYLGILGPEWNIPRLNKVTPFSPAGSILVAVSQTALYAVPNPTGWRLIGRTPFRGFAPQDQTPFKLSAGDEIVFEAVSKADYQQLEKRAAKGEMVAVRESLD